MRDYFLFQQVFFGSEGACVDDALRVIGTDARKCSGGRMPFAGGKFAADVGFGTKGCSDWGIQDRVAAGGFRGSGGR